MSYPNRMTAHLKQEKVLLGNLMKPVSAKKYIIIRSAELHFREHLVTCSIIQYACSSGGMSVGAVVLVAFISVASLCSH